MAIHDHAVVSIDDVWMNKVGLLLNFAAGFLLAPQLIGAERLQRVERRLERILRTLTWIVVWLRRRLRGKPQGFVAVAGLLSALAGALAQLETLGPQYRDAAAVFSVPFYVVLVTGIGFILAELLLPIVQRVVGRLARSLDGGDRLTSYMVGLGIVAFVVGNAMQFFAT
jgi:hypothetical protein